MNNERVTLAQELHDGIAQDLVVLGFSIDRAISQSQDTELKSSLRQIRFAATDLIEKVRVQMHSLRSAEPLVSSSGQVDTMFETLRVVQEILRNIEKHSCAKNMEIQINDDRTVHVVPRVSGVAEAVLVSTGQFVKKGQTLAVFSSQMISEQRSALQTAQKRLSLANTIYQREKTLWEQKITAEQDYLQALQGLREAEIAVDNSQQKLSALGVILNNNANSSSLNRFELRAPYDGLVVERNLSIGEAVKEDTPIFTISDLSTVWAEVHIPAKDLPYVRMGDKVTLRATAFDAQTTGTVAFIGALVGELTRMAKARIVLANPQGAWRPGLFVSVEVKAAEVRVPIAIETDALQTLGTQQVVFVRTETGFKAHPVKIGLNDGKHVEVVEGLAAGARYAAKGSYILKSELSKLTTEDGY